MEEIEFTCPYGKDVLKKAQDRLFKMYEEVAAIFDEHNITYFIAYGTLLGAVRHEGFIPWDDDFDICVMDDDYERGLQLLRENLSDSFFVMNELSDPNYQYPWTKVMDYDSETVSPNKINNTWKYRGVSIDLFKCSIEKTGKFDKAERANRHQKKNHLKKLARGKQKTLLKIRSLLILFVCYIRTLYHNLRAIFHKRNTEICVAEPIDFMFPPEWLYPIKFYEFEGKKCPGPNEAELILEKRFGDWKRIPESNDRQVHFENIKFLIKKQK